MSAPDRPRFERLDESPIELLRDCVVGFGYCGQHFLEQFTMLELVELRRAWLRSEWDIPPDQWAEHQIDDAIQRHLPPLFDDSVPVVRPPSESFAPYTSVEETEFSHRLNEKGGMR